MFPGRALSLRVSVAQRVKSPLEEQHCSRRAGGGEASRERTLSLVTLLLEVLCEGGSPDSL